MKLFHRKATDAAPPVTEHPDPVPVAAATNGEASVPEPAVQPAIAGDVVPAAAPPSAPVDRFDQLFEHWMALPSSNWPTGAMHVDHHVDGSAFVITAELPGLDPTEDVELTVSDGVLWVDGRHRDESRIEQDGYVRREVRYGAFSRSFPLPDGVTAPDIDATYDHGVLKIRVPARQARSVTRVPITTS